MQRTPEHGYTISSSCEPDSSGELKSHTVFASLSAQGAYKIGETGCLLEQCKKGIFASYTSCKNTQNAKTLSWNGGLRQS